MSARDLFGAFIVYLTHQVQPYVTKQLEHLLLSLKLHQPLKVCRLSLFSFFHIVQLHLLLAAASCYIEIILKESDNNVKIIVLDRLIALKENPNQERVLQVRCFCFLDTMSITDTCYSLQELVMDILRVLVTPDLEVRKKTLSLVLDLVSSRNIEEIVLVLKKVLYKSNGIKSFHYTFSYRKSLKRTIQPNTRTPESIASS